MFVNNLLQETRWEGGNSKCPRVCLAAAMKRDGFLDELELNGDFTKSYIENYGYTEWWIRELRSASVQFFWSTGLMQSVSGTQ